MDAYAPALLDLGQAVMIGKGLRSEEVRQACVRNKAVYLAAPGGAGAYLASCVKECEVVAFPDLGTEAIHKLFVTETDFRTLLGARGIYDSLEECCDLCEHAADIIEQIIIKNT